jgi:hypothetical protein
MSKRKNQTAPVAAPAPATKPAPKAEGKTKPAAPAPGGAKPVRRQAETLARYRANYVASVSATGAKSLSCGDDVASFLSGLAVLDVVALAERVCELPAGTLLTKYDRLNTGSKRMNAGNRIRAAVKAGDTTLPELKKLARGAVAARTAKVEEATAA